MRTTHNPSSITHNPVAKNHAFSSKERDVETGLSYFGSRYYSSELSIWLSVDPMRNKYPLMSPYVYCADNPVKLVDPNGEWPEDRAKRFINRQNCSHVYYEKDGSISVQYSKYQDTKSSNVVIRLKQFKMNFFERIYSKIQRPSESINKRHTHRGGIWGTTSDLTTHPPGQDESTDNNIEQTNLDPLQQLTVPKSHNNGSHFNSDFNESNDDGTAETSIGTSGSFIIFYNKKQDDGSVAREVKYNGTADSAKKRMQIKSNGEKVARINVDE